MATGSWLSPLLWFFAIIALIPLALWLLKRTPVGASAGQGVTRVISTLALSTSQRVVTIEVGQGDARRWLVLGVTPASMTTLHTMEPQADAPAGATLAAATPPVTAFAQLLGRLRQDKGLASER